MKIDYAVDLIRNKRLVIPCRSSFSDLYDKIGLEIPKAVFTPVPSFREKQMRAREQKKIYSTCILCWTLDRKADGGIDENFLMWKTYAGNNTVCRIGTTIGKLIDSIKKTPCDIVISDVAYSESPDLNGYEKKLFCKTKNYEDEREIRLLALCNRNAPLTIEIEPDKLLEEIIITPFASLGLQKTYQDYLGKICSSYNLKAKVRLSEIKEYPPDINNDPWI